MWDIRPPQNPKPKKQIQKPQTFEWRKAPATPQFRHFPWWAVILAFLVASAIVLGFIFKEKLKERALLLQQSWQQSRPLRPAEIKLEVQSNKKQPLLFYAVQNQGKVEIKSLNKNFNPNTLLAFSGSSLSEDSIDLGAEHIVYIDNEGVKLYSKAQKQTDLLLKSTQLSLPRKVALSEDKWLAILLTREQETLVSLYSLEQQKTIQPFPATDFVFGSQKLFFASQKSLYSYDVNKQTSQKITDFDQPVLRLFKTSKGIYLISGSQRSLKLWEIKENKNQANYLVSLELALDFAQSDFGWAQQENNLYLSFAGEIIKIDLKSKQKQKGELSINIYRLLGYLPQQNYFVALKKPSALKEFSLVVFNQKKILFESDLQEQIIYLGK